ncbi:MAG TPA: hypothetical protein VFU71_13010 [Burkholderiaceae bacterium]|nr:hypothetical protein [Burkholderiaceae bacterium]
MTMVIRRPLELADTDPNIAVEYERLQRMVNLTKRARELGLNTKTVDALVVQMVESLIALRQIRNLIATSRYELACWRDTNSY